MRFLQSVVIGEGARSRRKPIADEKVIRWNHIASPQTPHYKRYRLYAAVLIGKCRYSVLFRNCALCLCAGALTALVFDTYNAYDANIMLPWVAYEITVELFMYIFAYSTYRVPLLLKRSTCHHWRLSSGRVAAIAWSRRQRAAGVRL